MESITLTGRNSRLSLLQIELLSRRIGEAFPGININIAPRSSRGDILAHVPLQTVEGSDFFTADIFAALETGEADIAVHSLKDMSADHFFGHHVFALVDRDDPRDIALFHPQALEKIKSGGQLVIGTCSPRREYMATEFLQQALPQWHSGFRVSTRAIRGNVDSRLRKLDAGEYDGIILATAGLNRLLRSAVDAGGIQKLLQNKRRMLLPLVECVPAPCQGAIVAETLPDNTKARHILEKINLPGLLHSCRREKQTALLFGKGCDQPFGVTSISAGSQEWLYAAGKQSGQQVPFSHWFNLPEAPAADLNLFSSADHMGQFFHYYFSSDVPPWPEPVCFVANYKALNNEITSRLASRQVWASGTKTWRQLAERGIWVEGCADGLGLEALAKVWAMPLLNIRQSMVRVITHRQAATHWKAKGWAASGTYQLLPQHQPAMAEKMASADWIFWTSYRQFEQYKQHIKPTAVHACPSGETASLLKGAGIRPVEFPTIKAFQQWKASAIPSPSAA